MPHECQTCAAGFASECALERHVAHVHRERVRARDGGPCGTCGAAFASGRMLRLHARLVHGGAAPERCGSCARGFGSARDLNVHALERHGPARRYEHVCSHGCARVAFPTAVQLARHVEAVHALGGPLEGVYRVRDGAEGVAGGSAAAGAQAGLATPRGGDGAAYADDDSWITRGNGGNGGAAVPGCAVG